MEHQPTRSSPNMEQAQQKEEQRQLAPCFQKLYRKTGDAIEFRYQWISCDGESEPTGDAIATSTEETPHAPKGVEQGRKEGEKILEFCLARRMKLAGVPGYAQPCPQQSTIIHRAAQTVQKRTPRGVCQQIWQMEQTVEQMSTQQHPCDHGDKGLDGHIRRKCTPLSQFDCPKTTHQ